MLQRYTMYRGARPGDDPMPDGVRQDTRRHTSHCLRPPRELVDAYLAAPSAAGWKTFAAAYKKTLAERFAEDPAPFRAVAELASEQDVFIGCSCPTAKNPDVRHCHTWLALEYMKKRFPKLKVVFPK